MPALDHLLYQPGSRRTESTLRTVAHGRLLLLTTDHVGNNLFCTAGIRLLKKHLPYVELDVAAMSFRGAHVFDNNPDVCKVYLVVSKNNGSLARQEI